MDVDGSGVSVAKDASRTRADRFHGDAVNAFNAGAGRGFFLAVARGNDVAPEIEGQPLPRRRSAATATVDVPPSRCRASSRPGRTAGTPGGFGQPLPPSRVPHTAVKGVGSRLGGPNSWSAGGESRRGKVVHSIDRQAGIDPW